MNVEEKEIKKSTFKNKKYMIKICDGTLCKTVHFGDMRYDQYRDSTPLQLYSDLDHLDEKRKENYLKRARGIKDKNGNLTYLDPFSSNYYSIKYLW